MSHCIIILQLRDVPFSSLLIVAPLYDCSEEEMACLIPSVEEERWPIMEVIASNCK